VNHATGSEPPLVSIVLQFLVQKKGEPHADRTVCMTPFQHPCSLSCRTLELTAVDGAQMRPDSQTGLLRVDQYEWSAT
jgi:hypothetical protein